MKFKDMIYKRKKNTRRGFNIPKCPCITKKCENIKKKIRGKIYTRKGFGKLPSFKLPNLTLFQSRTLCKLTLFAKPPGVRYYNYHVCNKTENAESRCGYNIFIVFLFILFFLVFLVVFQNYHTTMRGSLRYVQQAPSSFQKDHRQIRHTSEDNLFYLLLHFSVQNISFTWSTQLLFCLVIVQKL